MSHVTQMNESRVMAHVQLNHVTRTNELFETHLLERDWRARHWPRWRGAVSENKPGTWFNYMCDMHHSYMWHGSSLICDHSYVTWRILICGIPRWFVWHALFTLNYTRRNGHKYVLWVMAHMFWIVHKCARTHPYVHHDSFICVTFLFTNESWYTYEWVMAYIWQFIHMNAAEW